MTTTALAYFLIICFFMLERLLRQGERALSLQASEADGGSSKVLLLSGLFSISLALLAPILNTYHIGHWNITYVGWLGVFVMLAGLVLRSWAAVALGKFYTRTLQTLEDQQIVDQAPYNVIRHPGYLGTFLIEIGAGLAVMNWGALVITTIIGALSRFYRIQVEETMLNAAFREQYKAYTKKTWRLIPLLY